MYVIVTDFSIHRKILFSKHPCTHTHKHTHTHTHNYVLTQLSSPVPAQAFLPPNTSLVSGRSGRIDCVVRGDPASSVSWFQPDSTMVTTSSLSRIRSLGNGTLSFSTVNPQDAGNYTCEVSNSLAVDSATVNLFVTGLW